MNPVRKFQANAVVTRNILSTFFLAYRVLLKNPTRFRQEDIEQALHALSARFV